MTGTPRRVEVVVDRLVLHDVEASDVDTVLAAFRAHLTGLAAGGPPTRAPDRAGVRASGPSELGRRAAAEVWRAAGAPTGAAPGPHGASAPSVAGTTGSTGTGGG